MTTESQITKAQHCVRRINRIPHGPRCTQGLGVHADATDLGGALNYHRLDKESILDTWEVTNGFHRNLV